MPCWPGCTTRASPGAGLDLAAGLWQFWNLRGHRREALGWLEHLLGGAPTGPEVRARALNALGNLAWPAGDLRRATAAYEEALALHRAGGDRAGIATTLDGLSTIARIECRFEAALALGQEALDMVRELDDEHALAVSLNNVAITLMHLGSHARAMALHEEALAIRRRLGEMAAAGLADTDRMEGRAESPAGPGESIAALLKRWRTAAGLSQEELAERAGISAQAISAIERGTRLRPHPRTLRALASGLRLPADDRALLLAIAARDQVPPE